MRSEWKILTKMEIYSLKLQLYMTVCQKFWNLWCQDPWWQGSWHQRDGAGDFPAMAIFRRKIGRLSIWSLVNLDLHEKIPSAQLTLLLYIITKIALLVLLKLIGIITRNVDKWLFFQAVSWYCFEFCLNYDFQLDYP